MTKPPLTPEQKEDYARRLKASLKTRRPRKVLRLLLALVALVAAVALIWRFNRPPLESPPLLLACLDGVGCVGEPVRTQAWLKIVESPPERSAGLTVHWQRVGEAGDSSSAVTDQRGIAVATDSRPAGRDSIRTMQAALQEPEARHDRGRVFVYPLHSRIVIVPLVPMTAADALGHDRDVTTAEVGQLAAWKSAGWQLVYAVTAADPIAYRSLRDWVRLQVQRGIPDGPVLLSQVADPKEQIVPAIENLAQAAQVILWSPEPPK